jgi:hypothetical protein
VLVVIAATVVVGWAVATGGELDDWHAVRTTARTPATSSADASRVTSPSARRISGKRWTLPRCAELRGERLADWWWELRTTLNLFRFWPPGR